MTFKYHCIHLTNKLSHIASLLNKVREFLPLSILKLLYNAHVHSTLSYCNTIWGSTTQSHLQPLILMQKRIIRIITNSHYLEHTRPLFKTTNILTLTDLNKFNNIYEFFIKNVPINQDNQRHNYLTRFRNAYRPHRSRTNLFDRSFLHLSPLYFHQLPNHIKLMKSPFRFKKELKKFLLSQY